MHVFRTTGAGGPEVLSFEERPDPTPGPSEVLVRVRATALNRADLLQLKGHYPPPPGAPPDIPGLEYAGEVVAVGPRVRRFQPGARVMGLVGGGAWAEQLTVHEREALPIPEGLDFTQAAAIPEVYFTAFDALVLQGGLRPGETVLVHAVASGVGSAAALLCRAMGVRVVGTGRNASKLERAREWGVAHTVLVEGSPPRFAQAVREATGGLGADVALDLVGGDYVPETLEALAPQGRTLLVGLVAGTQTQVNLGLILSKRLRITGTTLRSRPLEEKIAVAQAAERHLLPLFRAGSLQPVIDAVVPIRDIREALQRLAGNETVGKVVLRWE
ncbi:NAD(P)H-quinone oxidoreductase [Stigmatella aurantiaca]|uniref:Alcohol dehydrogenase superfamily, zinc-containing protein n=1 Tax=Stigmatella aurantiaca (strain DW4/3-1) TaxID=378806 RepID=Q08MG8_STIAD|nr:NAD(P)H-quinone oxidoreductase [Stigmatella aurantiaca]ADO72559.1 Alcohol dehydrogenase superfamily, zinc-containing protein [Stigmatella aurantiaca DW4/3-1]EAU61677.1 zinc-containing alcohol dehydrogenase superfamily [Stigmatella aurantiaca DW4/3-1]